MFSGLAVNSTIHFENATILKEIEKPPNQEFGGLCC